MIQLGMYHNFSLRARARIVFYFLKVLYQEKDFTIILMYSLLTVFSWVPVKRSSTCS